MNIPANKNAPVFSTNEIVINTSADRVWNILTDIHNWTKWQKDVTKTTVFGDVIEGTRFEWKAGGLKFKSRIHTSLPKSMFGWTGTTIGASAVHNWFFIAQGNQTIVKVEESLDGILPKLFRSMFQKNLDSGIIKSLEELKSASEQNTSL